MLTWEGISTCALAVDTKTKSPPTIARAPLNPLFVIDLIIFTDLLNCRRLMQRICQLLSRWILRRRRNQHRLFARFTREFARVSRVSWLKSRCFASLGILGKWWRESNKSPPHQRGGVPAAAFFRRRRGGYLTVRSS